MDQMKSMMKQDFAGEALSKQNIKTSLASLSCNLSTDANRMVCHVCIQCMVSISLQAYGSVSLVMGCHLAAFCTAGALLSYSLHSVHVLIWKHNLVHYVTKKQTKKTWCAKIGV